MGWRDFQNTAPVDLTDKIDFIPPGNRFNQLNPFNPPRDDSDKPSLIGPDTDPATATQPVNQQVMDAIKGGQAVPVWSEILHEWLCWVRDDQIKKRLQANGCELVIYSLGELAVIASMPAKDTKQIHELKKMFDVTINPPTHNGTRQ